MVGAKVAPWATEATSGKCADISMIGGSEPAKKTKDLPVLNVKTGKVGMFPPNKGGALKGADDTETSKTRMAASKDMLAGESTNPSTSVTNCIPGNSG